MNFEDQTPSQSQQGYPHYPPPNPNMRMGYPGVPGSGQPGQYRPPQQVYSHGNPMAMRGPYDQPQMMPPHYQYSMPPTHMQAPPPQHLMGMPQPPTSSTQNQRPERNPNVLVDQFDVKNLTQRISSKDSLDSQVEKILALMAEEFVKTTAEFACKLSKHRGSDTLEKDDVKFAIERLYNINVPSKPSNPDKAAVQTQQQLFPQASTSNYKQNLSLVKKANESNVNQQQQQQ